MWMGSGDVTLGDCSQAKAHLTISPTVFPTTELLSALASVALKVTYLGSCGYLTKTVICALR